MDSEKVVTLEQSLTRLAELKVIQDAGKATKPEYEALKSEVYAAMQDGRMDKTKPTAGIYGLITRKIRPLVTSQLDLENWLEQNGYAESDYIKRELNMDRVSEIAKSELKTNGQYLDGLEFQTTEMLSIRSAKEEV